MVAYQSGDESEGSGTDQDSNDSNASDSEASKGSSVYEIKDDAEKRGPIKRDRPSNETDEETSEHVETNDALKKTRITEGSLDGNSSNGFPAVAKAMDVDVATTTRELDTEKADSNETNHYEQIDAHKYSNLLHTS